MLADIHIALRFSHFLALMLLAGAAVCSAWLASGEFRTVMARRLMRLWLPAALINLISTLLILAVQGGLMGQGWPDVFRPEVWGMVLDTRFGAVWLWQIVLAVVTVIVVVLRPHRLQPLLVCLAAFQLIVLADTGHAAMRDGLTGLVHRLNHGLHLLAVAWWVGGLPPLLVCMRMAHKPRWRDTAITAMMRYSRYGHLAVAVAIFTGIINSLFILGWRWPWPSGYVQLLMVKVALVVLMVMIALVNRYLLVPRFTRSSAGAQRAFVVMTQIEMALAVLVILCVSIFATREPF